MLEITKQQAQRIMETLVTKPADLGGKSQVTLDSVLHNFASVLMFLGRPEMFSSEFDDVVKGGEETWEQRKPLAEEVLKLEHHVAHISRGKEPLLAALDVEILSKLCKIMNRNDEHGKYYHDAFSQIASILGVELKPNVMPFGPENNGSGMDDQAQYHPGPDMF